MRILAIIPAYNEEECIKSTVSSLVEACPQIDYLVINDGSKDATPMICRQEGFSYLSLPINTKLASAFQTGMKYACRNGYDAVVQFDADGQHLPEYIGLMADAMESNDADVVIASRLLAGEKPKGARGLGSRLISFLIRITARAKITDPTSGLRMYNRKLIKFFATEFDTSPEPDTIALLVRKGYSVVEIPAVMRERQGGESYLDLPHVVGYMARMCTSIVLFQWLR